MIVTLIIDKTPWSSTCIKPEWEKFCPLAELERIPNEVYGVFTRAAKPSQTEDSTCLIIGTPPYDIYVEENNNGVWKRRVTSHVFVNSSIESFIYFLNVFADSYPYYSDDDDSEFIQLKAKEIAETLKPVDPPAFSRADYFWPMLLEDFVSYAEFSTEFLKAEYGVDGIDG